MPSTFEPLSPNDPIFTGGVSFVFRSEPPQPEDEHEDVDAGDDE